VLALCAWALAAGNARAVHSNVLPDYWCVDNPGAGTCVVSATYDGSALSYSSPAYAVWASFYAIPGDTAHTVQWSIQPRTASDLSAALGHTFSIVIRTNVVPRTIDAFGASMTYTRSGPSSGKYTVTIAGQPVSINKQNGCTYPPGGPICTGNAPGSSAVLQGEIDDYNYTNYSDPSYPAGLVDSFYGMDSYTNITETGLPPRIMQVDGQNELQIDLADYHYLHDGATVMHGNFYLRIPATLLATTWGINDLSTLATDGLNASVGAGGGTLAVTVEPGNTGVQVQISGLTFSRRKLEIKLGKVTPRAPTHIKATRTGTTSAKVTFRAAKPRGQKVTGYKLSCQSVRGVKAVSMVTVTGRRSPLTVTKLVPEAYSCTLRARSKAGYGLLSQRFVIPR
jgi:hypothetical protein